MRISPAEAKLLAYFNGTLPRGVYPNCTLRVDCLLTGYVTAQIDYYPSFDGNLLYLVLFAIILIAQIVQGIVWKTWSYSFAIILGLVLECVGYVGRLALSWNPFVFDSFLTYLICLTIAPVFFTASIYLSLSRLIHIYDPTTTLSRFRPKTYTNLFISADSFSLVLQAIGGALSATANTTDQGWTGIHVMIGGLAFQVLSLAIFSALCAELAICIHRKQPSRSPSHRGRGASEAFGIKSLHAFELALAVVTILILVRSSYRCAELAGGFRGKLANEEAPFMVFEGVMMLLTCLCLTVWHPGWVMKGRWGRTTGKAQDIEGSELMGLGVGGKIDGVEDGTKGYVNIDVSERKRLGRHGSA